MTRIPPRSRDGRKYEMAEVRLILRDGEEEGTVDIDYEFNPHVTDNPTPAQFAAYFAIQWLVNEYFGPQSEAPLPESADAQV